MDLGDRWAFSLASLSAAALAAAGSEDSIRVYAALTPQQVEDLVQVAHVWGDSIVAQHSGAWISQAKTSEASVWCHHGL